MNWRTSFYIFIENINTLCTRVLSVCALQFYNCNCSTGHTPTFLLCKKNDPSLPVYCVPVLVLQQVFIFLNLNWQAKKTLHF